jgi:regulator of RNase E activity RraA
MTLVAFYCWLCEDPFTDGGVVVADADGQIVVCDDCARFVVRRAS